jgi:MtN3 and saliva related transmembrane protein
MRVAIYPGYLAGFLTVASFLPQVVRTWRTKQTKDLSVVTFVLLITASALRITYGVLESDRPVILTSVGMVALNCAILTAKPRYE